MIKDVINSGIGYNPGSLAFVITHGLTMGLSSVSLSILAAKRDIELSPTRQDIVLEDSS